MKVPTAALLFLASFGTTISSSHAKMVEFQVSSDGETNKQKKNVRKLQDDDGPVGKCIHDGCKEKCADLYCACADDCAGFPLNVDESCKKCAGDEITSGAALLEECVKHCSPNCNNEQKTPLQPQEKVEPKSSRAPVAKMALGKRFLKADGFDWDDFFDCKDIPTISPRPTMTPSISSAPSISAAPTTDCGIIDCDMTHSASCNPDPHYSVWSGTVSYYDFQGSCDQIAIDNSNLQLQMKTRGRVYYSTITKVALKMKASGELLTVDGTTIVTNDITTASLGATVTQISNYVQITFPTPAGDS
ncbi:predicted protein [Chaetoceros tenuissimus]|uniref:VWFD domain-containing protein n=1 Tax=Chaetoceros tenuissimus TaxID=426638 RepID=A0AAD3CS65_9STRA|nr:predicted protein [Chaetoceros tenuissimus]